MAYGKVNRVMAVKTFVITNPEGWSYEVFGNIYINRFDSRYLSVQVGDEHFKLSIPALQKVLRTQKQYFKKMKLSEKEREASERRRKRRGRGSWKRTPQYNPVSMFKVINRPVKK